MPGSILLGIGDEERAADIPNVERREAVGNAFNFKSVSIKVHALKVCVIDLDFRGTEIGNVEKFVAVGSKK